MYSLVLMATLSVGPSTPAHCWHKCHGCYGCHGCYSACHGCWGCHGCHGCYSYGCHGCYGCWGGCHGCYGCGCYSAYCHGCYSCYGCHGCYGCYGCHGCYGATVVVPAAPPAAAPAPAPKPPGGGAAPKVGEASIVPARARVIVELPADATLSVDNVATKANSATTRSFSTPELTPGQEYFYDLKAEVTRDGKPVTETKRVLVRAGAEVRASLLATTKEAGVATAAK